MASKKSGNASEVFERIEPMSAPEGENWSQDQSQDVDGWFTPEIAYKQREPFQGVLESSFEWEDSSDKDANGKPIVKVRKAYLVRLTAPYNSATKGEEVLNLDEGEILAVSERNGLKVLSTWEMGTEIWVFPTEKVKLKAKRTAWKFDIRKREAF